jgi:hypothetical protein
MTYLDDVGPVETILQFNLHCIVKLTILINVIAFGKITFISLLYYYHLLAWMQPAATFATTTILLVDSQASWV